MHRHATAEHASFEPDHLLLSYALPALEQLFDDNLFEGGKKFRALLECGSAQIFGSGKVEVDRLDGLAGGLARLTMDEPVSTLDLLHAMIAAQLTYVLDSNTKVWLDRLVQRFEVTKKIYEFYPPGFRNGEGGNTSVRLYWLFALALGLYFARSNKIKYISTLLKVCDLLCSLPKNMMQGHIPKQGLHAVLAAEMVSVQLLAEKKGVPFALN